VPALRKTRRRFQGAERGLHIPTTNGQPALVAAPRTASVRSVTTCRALIPRKSCLHSRPDTSAPLVTFRASESRDGALKGPCPRGKKCCKRRGHLVTGLLKANIPARVSFAVVSQTDSRVILDEPGAEDLMGKGQLLARIPGQRGLLPLQGEYVSIEDVDRVIKSYTEVRS
jgi:hypothetical protein